MSPRQRRGLVILLLAVMGVVVTFVALISYTGQVEAQLGPRQNVLVLNQPVTAYQAIAPANVTVRQIPIVFAPPNAVKTVAELKNLVAHVDLPAGTYLQSAELGPPPELKAGERAVTFGATTDTSVGESLKIGDVIDVYAAYEVDKKAVGTLEVTGVRVVAVNRPDAINSPYTYKVTVALTESDAISLVKAIATAKKLMVGRYPPDEVTP